MTGTLGLAYPATAAAMRKAVAAARAAGCLVLVDVNWRPVFWPDPEAAKPIIVEYLKVTRRRGVCVWGGGCAVLSA